MRASLLYKPNFNFKWNESDLKLATSSPTPKAQKWVNVLWKPTENALYFSARVIQPLPGKNKDRLLLGLAIRTYSLVFAICFALLALVTWLLLIPLHLWVHSKRPLAEVIQPAQYTFPSGPLSIRTHNIAQGPESVVVLSDLRPNKERAEELVNSILKDPQAPHFMVFQEAYNQTEALCKLKEKYPFIVHSIAPDVLGLSSGFFVASRYPIKGIEFRGLEMENPEKILCRGALKVSLQTTQEKTLDVFALHLQALPGKARADRRLEQLKTVKEWMESEYKEKGTPQLLVGDLNTSSLTAWGEDFNHPDQPEYKVLNYIQTHFIDPYKESPDRPTGTWYHGPFADKGLTLRLRLWWDRMKYHYPAPTLVKKLEIPTWGTSKWNRVQSARFDYVLIPSYAEKAFQTLDQQIKQIGDPISQSGVSDHLPVDYTFLM